MFSWKKKKKMVVQAKVGGQTKFELAKTSFEVKRENEVGDGGVWHGLVHYKGVSGFGR